MTIAEIIETLSQERNFGSRFPVRIIFVDNLDDYADLEYQLKGACDVTMNAAEFCRAEDTVPQFDHIKKQLAMCEGKQVLLLSIGEYLRLCIKRELDFNRCQFRSFWEMQQAESSRTRIIIPVFNCRDVFDRIVGTVDERQQNYVWTIDSARSAENYSISVFSPKFRGTISPDANSLTEWFRNWLSILSKKSECSIVTLQYSNVERSFGTVSIKQVDSPFRYLSGVVINSDVLDEKWLDDTFWSKAVDYASRYGIKKVTFEQLVFDILNVTVFDFISIAARWNTLNDFQKDLVWLWYRVYPTDEYYCFACKKASTAGEIPEKIRDEILLICNRSDRWIQERMAAVRAFSFHNFNDAYFTLMDKLPLPETKLKLLTYQTHEEKTYAVKIVSGLLRDGADPKAVASELLVKLYPALASYMQDQLGQDEATDEYMFWYRKNKLINRYSGEGPTNISLDRFDTRYSLVHKQKGKDCKFFWIDGFGIEYVPVFLYELKLRGIVPELVKQSTSILPTETEYNHQWDEHDPMTIKWDRLDAYSHRGVPDDKSYYSCIVNQLSVFSDAAKKVEELLADHEYVVVTGDHGSSRMAALAFHEESVVPIAAPKKSIVHSYGRFCELGDNAEEIVALPGTKKIILNARQYLVMENYQHFSVGGNLAGGNTDENDVVGEVHGGNTPEERLVPVIVIKKKRPMSPVVCWPSSPYFIKKNGHVELLLTFNQSVSFLEVFFEKNEATCVMNEDGSWRVILDGVSGDSLALSVIANGKLLPNVVLKAKMQGISKNDEPFGATRL